MENGRYEALVSDFDGVIYLDSEEVNIGAMIETMSQKGFMLTKAEIARIPGHSCANLLPDFLACRGVGSKHCDAVIEENRKRYDEIWDAKAYLDPTVEKTLRELHGQGVPIAIATTNRRNVVNKFLDRFELQDVIAVIVAAEDVTMKKPHPEVYEKAWQRLGKKRSLAVEDMPIGVASARTAGLHCAGILNKYCSEQKNFWQATYVLESFGELTGFF